MIYSEFYDTDKIEKEWQRLKIPPEYHFFNLDEIFTNDISFYLSIRKDAGKTTNSIILGMILHKLYGVTCEYIRNDTEQTVFGVIGKLFDTIKDLNYIQRLFGCYNDVEYSTREKAFTLIYRNTDGEVERKEETSFFRIKSNENYSYYKSSYNSPKSWFLIWDEFLDSKQSHGTIVSKLFNNISTFTRDNPRAHVVALSNTVNKYDAIFEDLNLLKEIEFMDFGEKKNLVTDLGSRYHVELLPVSAVRKKMIEKKNIRFYGINKNKFANFTGVEAWKGYNYKHILDEPVKEYTLVNFIHHRDRWMALSHIEFDDADMKPALHVSKSAAPRGNDLVTYTTEPTKINEWTIKDCPNWMKKAIQEDRVFFSSNEIGLLFDDFMMENGIKIEHK